MELDGSAVSNAIAEQVLGEIIESGGDVQDSAVQILQQDASVAVQDFGVPRGYWIVDHVIGQVMYPNLSRPEGTLTFGTAVSNLIGLNSAASAVVVELVTLGAASRALDSHLDAQIALAEAHADGLVSHNGDYVSPQSPETPNNPSNPQDPGDSGDKDPWNGNDAGNSSSSDNEGSNGISDGGLGVGGSNDADNNGHEDSDNDNNASGSGGSEDHTGEATGQHDSSDNDASWWPVVIDLDQDGVELAFGKPIYFDWDDDGYIERSTWAAADDGFLVLDLNADGSRGVGDGKIDQARELAFSLWGNASDTDLQALGRAFDLNRDGVLNASDAVWSELRIWQDLDQDAVTDDGELKTLADWGITEINLTYDNGAAFDNRDDDITVFGNTLAGLASYTRDGVVVEGGVGDIALAASTDGWKRVETSVGFDLVGESSGVQTRRYIDLSKPSSANSTLSGDTYAGAYGDSRHNILNGVGATLGLLLDGGAGNDSITGSASDDVIIGGEGVDTLNGGAGDDLLALGEGASNALQIVKGGAGSDIYVLDANSGLVYLEDVSETGSTDRVVFQGIALTDVSYKILHGELVLSWSSAGGAGSLSVANKGLDIESFEFANRRVTLEELKVVTATSAQDIDLGTVTYQLGGGWIGAKREETVLIPENVVVDGSRFWVMSQDGGLLKAVQLEVTLTSDGKTALQVINAKHSWDIGLFDQLISDFSATQNYWSSNGIDTNTVETGAAAGYGLVRFATDNSFHHSGFVSTSEKTELLNSADFTDVSYRMGGGWIGNVPKETLRVENKYLEDGSEFWIMTNAGGYLKSIKLAVSFDIQGRMGLQVLEAKHSSQTHKYEELMGDFGKLQAYWNSNGSSNAIVETHHQGGYGVLEFAVLDTYYGGFISTSEPTYLSEHFDFGRVEYALDGGSIGNPIRGAVDIPEEALGDGSKFWIMARDGHYLKAVQLELSYSDQGQAGLKVVAAKYSTETNRLDALMNDFEAMQSYWNSNGRNNLTTESNAQHGYGVIEFSSVDHRIEDGFVSKTDPSDLQRVVDLSHGGPAYSAGDGVDRFEFSPGDGDIVISNFEDGDDLIALKSQEVAYSSLSFQQQSNDAVIEFANGEQLTLQNFAVGSLSIDDFVFS